MVEDIIRFPCPCLMRVDNFESLHVWGMGGGGFRVGDVYKVTYERTLFERWVLNGFSNSSIYSFRDPNSKIWKGEKSI
jgi:hypothetical protein